MIEVCAKSIEEKALHSILWGDLESFMVVVPFKWDIERWVWQVWRAFYLEETL